MSNEHVFRKSTDHGILEMTSDECYLYEEVYQKTYDEVYEEEYKEAFARQTRHFKQGENIPYNCDRCAAFYAKDAADIAARKAVSELRHMRRRTDED
ncbi:hypothetical protein LJC34_05025 [Oscillospiraceae bacterium OttesenSCG-928-G22]|nr:hypothetical protein [Oscillospiraceae bacterium OttesenSCG-928-G22]